MDLADFVNNAQMTAEARVGLRELLEAEQERILRGMHDAIPDPAALLREINELPLHVEWLHEKDGVVFDDERMRMLALWVSANLPHLQIFQKLAERLDAFLLKAIDAAVEDF